MTQNLLPGTPAENFPEGCIFVRHFHSRGEDFICVSKRLFMGLEKGVDCPGELKPDSPDPGGNLFRGRLPQFRD